MKILTVIGARPQFIKAAAVSKEINQHREVEEVIIHTGQHFDKNMSAIFFEEMGIPKPKYQLDIHSLSHGAMTGRMMEEIEKIALLESPDFLMVYGDTNSTLAAALAAKKLKIKVIHVEAGLRSFNMDMPEEINRILTDRISDLLFCPTESAIENLKNEGFDNFNVLISNCGDVMEDAALQFSEIAEKKSQIRKEIHLKDEYILCTIHRAENTDDIKKLRSIVEAINEINEAVHVILPVHPRTKKIFDQNEIKIEASVIEPVGYLDMLELIKNSKIIMTDSGGLQKEAFFFDKFCITLREETEWVELVKNGYNKISGSDKAKIINAYHYFKAEKFIKRHNFYGGGNASKRILMELKKLK